MKITTISTLTIIAAMTSYSLFGQHKPQMPVNEKRPVSGFHSLMVSGLAEVYLKEGPSREVKIAVSGMPAEDVVVTTADSILTIATTGSHSGESVKVYVDYTILKSITVSGAAKLFGESTVKAKNLSISVTQAGAASLDVDVHNLSLSLKQAGDLTITGKVVKQEILSAGQQGTLNDSGLVVAEQ